MCMSGITVVIDIIMAIQQWDSRIGFLDVRENNAYGKHYNAMVSVILPNQAYANEKWNVQGHVHLRILYVSLSSTKTDWFI